MCGAGVWGGGVVGCGSKSWYLDMTESLSEVAQVLPNPQFVRIRKRSTPSTLAAANHLSMALLRLSMEYKRPQVSNRSAG